MNAEATENLLKLIKGIISDSALAKKDIDSISIKWVGVEMEESEFLRPNIEIKFFMGER